MNRQEQEIAEQEHIKDLRSRPLPDEMRALIDASKVARDTIALRLKGEEAARATKLADICDNLGLQFEILSSPLCLCDDLGHAVRHVEFPLKTWETDIRAWLMDKPTIVRFYKSYQSGDQNDPKGDLLRFRFCDLFIRGKASALTILARNERLDAVGENENAAAGE